MRRSSRIAQQEPITYNYFAASEQHEYDETMALVTAQIIQHYEQEDKLTKEFQLIQTYSLGKGLKKFGDRATKATMKEMGQIDARGSFKPIHPSTLTELEKKRVMESLIFLVEKKSGEVKARHCANGSSQRIWMDKKDASSPTVGTNSLFITAAIDAKEKRHVKTADVPNAFLHAKMKETDKDGARIIMKIRGPLVDILVQMNPLKYSKFVIQEGKHKVLYVQILRALYGMLQSALLYYKRFRKDIEAEGFKVNNYDPCVANKMVNGKQLTLTWHVDDIKMSHQDEDVLNNFIEWLTKTYGDIGEVKVTEGKRHHHLGMILDYTEEGSVKIDMCDYVNEMIEDFSEDLKGKVTSIASENLFKVDKASPLLNKDKAKEFHTTVAKALFLAKRARPDIQTTVAFLCTRVANPTNSDWNKLYRLMVFLQSTKDECLKLTMDDTGVARWYVDAAYAVHPDMKSHTGAFMTMGRGAFISSSNKQKINTRSSTEAELIGVDDVISTIVWTKLFLMDQGIDIKTHIVFQDNHSAIQLEENGLMSSGRRTRHLNIKYFLSLT